MTPYSNEEMTYNKNTHRYVLTKNYCVRNNVDLDAELNTYGMANKSAAAENLLDRISRIIYQHCYRHGMAKEKKEHDIATVEAFRDVIRDAMMEQLLYVMANGDYFLALATIDNYKCAISGLAHDILADAGLCSAGVMYPPFEPTYEEEGY